MKHCVSAFTDDIGRLRRPLPYAPLGTLITIIATMTAIAGIEAADLAFAPARAAITIIAKLTAKLEAERRPNETIFAACRHHHHSEETAIAGIGAMSLRNCLRPRAAITIIAKASENECMHFRCV
jgi:hypothetical protein